jgi:repressor LexA
MDLTKRQAKVLQYVRSHQEKYGITPTVREICGHFGLTGPAGIHRILHVLVDKGYISTSAGKKRSWRIPGSYTGKSIPLIGRIAAGVPILAVENREEELPVDPSIFGVDNCFALHIQGDSMIDVHIKDGDLAIIRPQNHADNGEIVAVVIIEMEHEATLKILRKNQYKTELRSANRAYPLIIFSGRQRSRIRIIGKCVGIIRRE